MKFLTAISHDLYYRTAQYVTNPVASVYMKELVTIYKKGGLISPIFIVIMNFTK
jgi:hypothetical protein